MQSDTEDLGTHAFSAELRAEFPETVDKFDQFEAQIAAWEGIFKRARGMAEYEEQRFRDTRLLRARRQVGHLAASTAIRLVDLSSGLVVLLNAKHAHAAYATARAIFETAAVPAYTLRNVMPLVAKGRRVKAAETLKRLVMGVDPGIALEVQAGAGVHPIRVSKLVDSLCAEADAAHSAEGNDPADPPGRTMRRLYSTISDCTHPNHSAMHISAKLDEDDYTMSWRRPALLSSGVLLEVLGTSYLALLYGQASMNAVLKKANQHQLVLADKRYQGSVGVPEDLHG